MLSREESPCIVIGSDADWPKSSPTHSESNTHNRPITVKSPVKSSPAPGCPSGGTTAHGGATIPVQSEDGIVPSKRDGHVPSPGNSINSSQPRAVSTLIDRASQPVPSVPQLSLNHLPNRPSTTSAPGGASASQVRTCGTSTGASATSSASPTSLPANRRPPSVPVARCAAGIPPTPSVSMPRATTVSVAVRRTGGSAGSKAFMPQVSTVAPNYTSYPSDVSKYLKEVIRRREEALMLQLLPTAQQMDQTVLQAQTAYELMYQQEALEFLQIAHKRKEAEMKRKELELVRANKEKIEEQKNRHRDEMLQHKGDVAVAAKQTTLEIKEKLMKLVSLQPKLNIATAVMAQLQDPASDCALLGALMMEDKQLQKALKADARYNKSNAAAVDGGALPYWWKQCVCASFNVAAIMKQKPYRASILDVPFTTRALADKKVVVVKDGESNVVAWAHTRSGPDPNALAETYLGAMLTAQQLPANTYKGILWPKEDAVEVMRSAKAPKSTTAAILPEVITMLSHDEISSSEMSKKDVAAAGEAAF